MEWTLFVIALVFFLAGIVGLFLPIIPSLPLVWVGILGYGFFTGFEKVTADIVLTTGVIALVGTIIDFVAGAMGAKAYGSTWRGMAGALVGGLIGLIFLSVIGLIIGSAIGAFGAEYLMHRDRERAMKAMWGTMIGFVLGLIVKIAATVWMIVLFFRAVF